MEKTNNKKSYLSILLYTFLFLIISSFILKFIDNPHDKYRAEHASPTGHTIIIDEHFRVSTISAKESLLTYSEASLKDTGTDTYDYVFSIAVDLLNWNEDYIILSAKGHAGDSSYMIINRHTLQSTGYSSKKDFEAAKEEKGIKVNLKSKNNFDWY